MLRREAGARNDISKYAPAKDNSAQWGETLGIDGPAWVCGDLVPRTRTPLPVNGRICQCCRVYGRLHFGGVSGCQLTNSAGKQTANTWQ